MCSFIFSRTLQPVPDTALGTANRFARFRGPDLTTIHRSTDGFGGCLTFLHNLLDISGHTTVQPVTGDARGNELVLLFNGEIYNHRDLGGGASDTGCLLPAYQVHGDNLGSHLDGEFAVLIYDGERNRVAIFTDPFLTKPVYLAERPDTGEFGVATCASSLRALGFDDVRMAEPNALCTYEITAAGYKIAQRSPVWNFNTDQYKAAYDDWETAFVSSVARRARHGAKFPSVFLSSGYDSGAICQALNLSGIPYDTFSITSGENRDILETRIRINKAHSCRRSFRFRGLSPSLTARMATDIATNVEPFVYQHEDKPGLVVSVQSDGGAVGANYIARESRERGRFVNLSGSGADEILSDYGFAGQKFYPHSEFGGLFPESLEGFFPWRKFYGDTQRSYLFKDEFILGRSGIEGRYPFLDRTVVQEFLSLKADLKNRAYKAPIDHFLTKYRYPFELAVKRGFAPAAPPRTFRGLLRTLLCK